MPRIVGYSQVCAGIEVHLDCGCTALLADDKVMLVAWDKVGFTGAIADLERHDCPAGATPRLEAPAPALPARCSKALPLPSDD